MNSLDQRYSNDNNFRALVDQMINAIYTNKFTPSEMREAAIYASIKYEMMQLRGVEYIDVETAKALCVLDRKRRENESKYEKENW